MSLIVSEFYKGQGLGNQLFTYASTRGLAKLSRKDFGFVGLDAFKGNDLFELDFGKDSFDYPQVKYFERRFLDPVCRHDIGVTDANLLRQIKATVDSLKIEGLLAGKGYWPGGMKFLRSILPIKSNLLEASCRTGPELVLHVRGGDFLASNSTLGVDYYHSALEKLGLKIQDAEVITDDPDYARSLLGNGIHLGSNSISLRHSMTADHHQGGSFVLDFVQIMLARRIILSNSSFSFWAAVLNQANARVIAPKYWAARNCVLHHWSLGDFFFEEFEYV